MLIFVTKKRRRPYKDKAFVAALSTSKPCSQSRNIGIPKFSIPSKAFNKPTNLPNSRPSLPTFQVSKYTKNDLQQIFKTVLKAQTFIAYG